MAAAREHFHDERAGGGGGRGSVGVDDDSVNYSVVSSESTDNWTCEHNCFRADAPF